MSSTVADTPTPLPSNATVMPGFDLSLLPDVLPASMKGYELVSWQSGGKWRYTLVTDTNMQKTFEELVSPQSWIIPDGSLKLTTSSLDDLISILERLPAGSEIVWGGMDLGGEVDKSVTYFTYPPDEIFNQIKSVCDTHKINLVTLKEME